MVTVKLFGLLRLDSGIREIRLEAATVKEVYEGLLAQTDRITRKDIERCVILINGRPGKKRSRLRNDDEVILLSPVAGG